MYKCETRVIKLTKTIESDGR